MKYTNYRDAVTAIVNREAFRSNTLSGWATSDGFAVFSYQTLIALFAYNSDGVTVKVNRRKYSVTTSKHQHYVQQAISRMQSNGVKVVEVVEVEA